MKLRKRDERTGRPLDETGPAIESLTDRELDEELTIAAAGRARARMDRFEALWQEWLRRRTRAGL